MNGVSEDTLHGVDLFSPTVQRSENRSGFGLGLSIARQAVEAHLGRIDVNDVPGTGCVFRIRLPQPDANRNLQAPPRIEADHGNENRRSRD